MPIKKAVILDIMKKYLVENCYLFLSKTQCNYQMNIEQNLKKIIIFTALKCIRTMQNEMYQNDLERTLNDLDSILTNYYGFKNYQNNLIFFKILIAKFEMTN